MRALNMSSERGRDMDGMDKSEHQLAKVQWNGGRCGQKKNDGKRIVGAKVLITF